MATDPAAPAPADPAPAAPVEPAAPVAAAAAPEKPAELKFPEGLSAKDLGELAPHIKDQKALDSLVKLDAARQAKQDADLATLHKSWQEAIKSDKDFGGDKFDGSMKAIQRLVVKYGDKETLDFFNGNPIGDNPVVFRLLAKLGHAMAEDTVAGTSNNGAAPDSQEAAYRALYPNSPSLFRKE